MGRKRRLSGEKEEVKGGRKRRLSGEKEEVKRGERGD